MPSFDLLNLTACFEINVTSYIIDLINPFSANLFAQYSDCCTLKCVFSEKSSGVDEKII